MITYVIGDLLASSEPVIAHGCNTRGAMGAGIALHVANRWPEVERVYAAHCRTRDFHVGTAQLVNTQEMVELPDGSVTHRHVFNLGTQRNPGRDGTYWAVMLSFGNMFEICVDHGIKRVAIPRIGCGIAGLEWNTVEFVINGIYDWVPNGPEIVVYTQATEAHKW